MNISNPAVPLRVWPGVAAVTCEWLSRFGYKAVVPGFGGFASGMVGSFVAAGAVVVWWMFFSRARWVDRLGAIALMVVAIGTTWQLNHESMGVFWLLTYGIHVLLLAFVACVVVSRRLPIGLQRVAVTVTIVLACGLWTFFRTEGVTGDHALVFHWRWIASPEEQLLAHAAPTGTVGTTPGTAVAPAATAAPAVDAAVERPAERRRAEAGEEAAPVPAAAILPSRNNWLGFRGDARDGVVRGVRIETDWSKAPPIELWRRPVGPGWSSFAVSGNLVYTQEQRGDDEVVAAYKTATGEPVWMHRAAARFYEPMGGAGPRSTPTVSGGRVYTFGATGIVTALDAGDGAVVWSRDGATDADVAIPDWGFSSSPLVVDDLVIVAVSGKLVAYDRGSGTPRWIGSWGGGSYSSPQLFTIDGVTQVVLTSGVGAISVTPADGKRLWGHAWPGGFPIVQPALVGGTDILIAVDPTSGVRRVAITHGAGGWSAEKRWGSSGLKPYFNDFVVHKGHAYGFDGRILACIDLADGARKWKGGRYGNGQLMLLPDQDLLLVLSDEGQLALVRATADQFTELARVPALTGKTWNHPVLVGDVLLVRNGEEMATYRLPLTGR